MASQPGSQFSPDARLIAPPPGSGYILPGDAIEDRLESLDLPTLDVPLDQILGSTRLSFRDDVELPELSDNDSDSDEQPDSPPSFPTSFFTYSKGNHRDERVTVIGGAIVRNVCIVVPGEDGKGFADLPVQPIQASHGKSAQLVATILEDKKQKPPMPFLILPQEHDSHLDNTGSDSTFTTWSLPSKTSLSNKLLNEFSGVTPWTLSAMKKGGSDVAKAITKVDEEANNAKLGKSELKSYVLSGDIDNFWGIKGLTVKLYKQNGKIASTLEGADPTLLDCFVPTNVYANSRQVGEPEDNPSKSKDEGKSTKPSGENAKTETHSAKPKHEVQDDKEGSKNKDKTEEKDGEKKDEKKDKKKDAPVMEKIKFNTENVYHKSELLSTLFSFINNDKFKNLPVENVEITYSEEKNNFLYKPGLRLELDVSLKDGLAWVGNALNNLFDPKDPPKTIHLSAHLSDTRDWSKAPKIENLILQGSFPPLSPKTWDMVSFKTLGIEITATKANKGKASKEEKSEEKKAGAEKSSDDKTSDDGSRNDEDGEVKDDVAVTHPIEEEVEGMAEHDNKGSTEGKAGLKAKEEEESDKDDKKEKKDDKAKEDKSWHYGFAFFGTLALTNVPHTNVPLEMNYRIARDFVPPKKEEKKDDKKSDKKDDKKDKNTDKPDDDSDTKTLRASDEATKDDTKDLEKTEKAKKDIKGKYKDGGQDSKHKRSWNMVIKADKWKDIYGIKNLTMSKAEFTTSFNEGEFWATVQLELSAEFKLGDGNFKAKGHLSRDDSYLEAEVGELTLTDIRKIKDQMQGKKLTEDDTDKSTEKEMTKGEEVKKVAKKEEEKKTDKEKEEEKKIAAGNEITFNELKLNLSRKKVEKEETVRYALELNGKVTFNEHACSTASLVIATDGVSITGGISDFKIPGHEVVVIQRAGLEIFIALNTGGDTKAIDNEKKAGDSNETKEIGEEETKTPAQGGVKAKDEKNLENADKESSDKALTETKKAKRASRFGILGVVKFNNVTIEAGFYTEQKKDTEKREWLAFGAIKTLRLRDVWESIPAENFLNLQLDNLALIASSEERKKKDDKKANGDKEGEEEKGDKDKKEGKGDQQENDKESPDTTGFVVVSRKKKKTPRQAISNKVPAGNYMDVKSTVKGKDGKSKDDKKDDEKDGKKDDKKKKELTTWDVLGTVDTYNYPIVKGVQLCATISSFTELETLNKGKKIDGLTLIISINSEGKFAVSIDMPKSFRLKVTLSDCTFLDNFGTTVAITSKGPELQLRATLTLTFKDSDPICVEGVLVGTFEGAGGYLKMSDESKWMNPFNLNKNMTISRLGVDAGITYSTFMATGPSKLALRGQLNIGDKFQASVDMGLNYIDAGALLKLTMSRLDVVEVVQLAGVLMDNVQMQEMKGKDKMLVFQDLLFYLSSGATFFGTYYKRGIQIEGKMEFLDKKGEFKGRLDEGGAVIEAGIDNFNIGGLEVTSTREGAKRATMDIELTNENQKVFIDGKISYHDLLISILIDVDIEQRRLKADVTIRFMKKLSIKLKADIEAKDHEALQSANVNFEGTLDIDLFGAIQKGIEASIDALKQLATDEIQKARSTLKKKLHDQKAIRDKMREELKQLDKQLLEEKLKKQEVINEENKNLDRLCDELNEAKRAYDEAKVAKEENDAELAEKSRMKQAAQDKLDRAKQKIREGYNKDIKEQEEKQREWEIKRNRLIASRDARWSDAIRSKEAADENWRNWEIEEKRCYQRKNNCNWYLNHCTLWERPYWNIELFRATLDLEEAHLRKAAEAELLHAAKAITDSQPFRDAEDSIRNAGKQIEKFGKVMDALNRKDLSAMVNELAKNEKADLTRQINDVDALLAKSKQLQDALIAAKKALDSTSKRLTPQEEMARLRIEELKKELKMLPSEQAYEKKQAEVESIEVIIDDLDNMLQNAQDIVDGLSQVIKDAVNLLGKAYPRVTQIVVKASSRTFVNDEPLLFNIQAEWLGQTCTVDVEWAPWHGPARLYSDAARVLAACDQFVIRV
ncbi:hypothetical protein FAVG1_02342 [Fusarium avenaceum]|nr:hypothetical protein FAVG1_02342 [Fusarium avenaceum]